MKFKGDKTLKQLIQEAGPLAIYVLFVATIIIMGLLVFFIGWMVWR